MNIIFLDVDGVLNSINKLIEVYNKTHKQHSGYNYPFDENCLLNLQKLVYETDSKIVITSTWRKHKKNLEVLHSILKEYNLDSKVIGYTPILNKKREFEIKEYLKSINENINFIILDDDSDLGELLPFLINTNPQIGLSYQNVLDGIKILKK